jgi:Fe-S-cluster containining protein
MNLPPSKDGYYKKDNIDCGACPVGQFCCTLKVKLSFLDRMRIRLKNRIPLRRYADRLLDNSGWGINLVNGDCYFLERSNGKAFCKIYSSRPKICREFPHFFEEINDCRDIVKKWKRKVVDGVEITEIHVNSDK